MNLDKFASVNIDMALDFAGRSEDVWYQIQSSKREPLVSNVDSDKVHGGIQATQSPYDAIFPSPGTSIYPVGSLAVIFWMYRTWNPDNLPESPEIRPYIIACYPVLTEPPTVATVRFMVEESLAAMDAQYDARQKAANAN